MSRGAVLGLPSQAPAPLSFLMTSAYLSCGIVGAKTSSLRGRNMKIWAFVIVVLAFILPMGLVSAADRNGDFSVRGHGNFSCGSFVLAKDRASQSDQIDVLIVLAWTNGYLTRYNELAHGTYDIFGSADLPAVELWLYNYCKAHPLQSISEAMFALIIELYPRRKVQAPN